MVKKKNTNFTGKFTIVNIGTIAVNGWELLATMPSDHIKRVWDGAHHMSGATLVIDPSSGEKEIAPGGTLIEYVMARGTSTSPTSCTFNGSSC